MISHSDLSTISFQDKFPQSRQVTLECELRQVLLYGPALGIYVLPSLDNYEVWNAIILVRHGYYKQGMFKFDIDMRGFPETAPQVIFKTSVFHPLVHPKTHLLDVETLIGEPWNPAKEVLFYRLINAIQKMFTKNDSSMSCKHSFNPEAGSLFEQNTTEFIFKTMRSVEESIKEYQRCKANEIFEAGNIPEWKNKEILLSLKAACGHQGTIEDKIQYFVDHLFQ